MAKRSRRELEIADHLWDCIDRIAEDSGTDSHAVVNQAIYELARRFNFLTPMAKDARAPESARAEPPRSAPEPVAPPAPAPVPEPAAPAAPPPAARPAPAPASPSRAAPPPRAAPAKALYVINSAGDMHKVDKDTFIIGRSRTCDLVIPSSKVSRQHSGVCRENGEFYIEDLGSANGVWKDGVKVQKERVQDGDEFMISEEVLRFVFR